MKGGQGAISKYLLGELASQAEACFNAAADLCIQHDGLRGARTAHTSVLALQSAQLSQPAQES